MINGNYVLPVLKAVWLKKVMPLVSYKKLIVLVLSVRIYKNYAEKHLEFSCRKRWLAEDHIGTLFSNHQC